MKVEKRYSTDQYNEKFYISFTIKDYFDGGIIDCENLVDKHTRYININNINDVKFLQDNNIDYIEETYNSTNETQIIPIGLFDFNGSPKHTYTQLLVYNCDGKDLYKSEQIIGNIEKALRIKYRALEFKNKCKANNVDTIPFDKF
ncbi:hypothetical protein [Clostridium felsineum]|uniref:Uncharacterized protein n=1 Tax=Clostridium felsineum TaxID=36839 RepID=A0A1S8L399_9CLOT|nr:hypothetical protein [Clostridium felsineum]URZ07552.1 hypothetical protein CLROS_028910 [Clostridium felsineum]URZ12583.1 hypothetical protein CROST_033060 [Clostridium felsineum]